MKKITLFFLVIIPLATYAHWLSDVTIKGYYKIINTSNSKNSRVDSCLVTGHIYDAQTKSTLPYAWVKIRDTKIGVSADSLGNYSLKVPLGRHRLVAGSGSNLELRARALKFCQGKSLEIDFYLGKNIIVD